MFRQVSVITILMNSPYQLKVVNIHACNPEREGRFLSVSGFVAELDLAGILCLDTYEL